MQATTNTCDAIHLKASSYTLTTLYVLDNDLVSIYNQLKEKIRLAPNFFRNAPIVLDLSQLRNKNQYIDFNELAEVLNRLELKLAGLKHGEAHHHAQAQICNIAILSNSKVPKPNNKTSSKPTNIKSGKLISTPVRSGQQIVNSSGDIVITSSIGNGAEVISHGHIHVYGALKGKALAGVSGDRNARIFCSSLEAELVSIAGIYIASEDIEKKLWKAPAMIHIVNDKLQIDLLQN